MSTANPTGVDENKDDRLRSRLWRDNHASPFEFCDLTVEIEAPIFVARQIFRHRTFSFNEFSLRYSEHGVREWAEDYLKPEAWRLQDQANKQMSAGELYHNQELVDSLYMEACSQAFAAYEEMLARGVSREQARMVLPQSTYTRWRQKGNLRNWLGFLSLRMAADVQPETRVVAERVAEVVRELWPKCYNVWEAGR